MRIELLYWDGCPSHPRALADLRAEMTKLSLKEQVVVLRIATDEQALNERFTGSPTIRIDGEDIVDPGADAQPSLTCRIYRRADGSISPTPEPAAIGAALRATLRAQNSRDQEKAGAE